MPVPTSKIRGARDIRSHGGRAEEIRLPHQALLKVAWLEMEKYRRVSERESAIHRVANIDQRLKEIQGEQQALMAKAGLARESCNPNSGSESGCRSQESGFAIRY